MIDLSSPLASGKENRTLEACPVCHCRYSTNDHRFVVLNVGALKREGPDHASMSAELSGLMSLFWHDHAGACASLEVVNDAAFGQADLTACSFDCMRKLLVGLVDQLELKLEKHKYSPSQT